MNVYRRGKKWWYKFQIGGIVLRETTQAGTRTAATQAAARRIVELQDGIDGVKKRAPLVQLLGPAARAWVENNSRLGARSRDIERLNIRHLESFFGKRLLCDIDAQDVAEYQKHRQSERAANKTINLEVGTLRAVLRKNRLWANLQPDVNFLPVKDTFGRAITAAEEVALFDACRHSRSRSLYTVVMLALSTGMRKSELRLLRWHQLDLGGAILTVGKSKTDAGEGRRIPLNPRALAVMRFWAQLIPARDPQHFVFPSERYGAAGNAFTPKTYKTDPTKPTNNWKEAWEAAKQRAGAALKGDPDDKDAPALQCRFHDLRHTACSRMLEAGAPFPVVSEIMGWSASTAVRMAKRYGHMSDDARRRAVEFLMTRETQIETERAQKRAQTGNEQEGSPVN